MFIRQIYTTCLAQASYYLESDGIAAVIDPIRDVDQYLELARERQAKIAFIFISHFHADFVSGHLELQQKSGATIVFGPLAKPDYPAHIAKDHELFKLGSTQVELLHTPGHTIESSCFLLYDETGKAEAIFTGDTLFIGDAGRPDLLSGNLDANELAGQLYDSIHQKIKPLSDEVLVYPGHGAGSACGKKLSRELTSTIGEQKKHNYVFLLDRNSFIEAVCDDQPIAPPYFFKDAQINKRGYQPLDEVLKNKLIPLSVKEFKAIQNEGTLVLDTREAAVFARQFIPGSINISLEGQFAVWAGTVLDFNQALLLVTEPGDEKTALIRLARIGYENIKGYLDGGFTAWLEADENCDHIRSISLYELKASIGAHFFELLDVRNKAEFDHERLNTPLHIPLEELRQRLEELDPDKHLAIYCAGGYRSMIAASMLKREGFCHLVNLEGGISKIRHYFPELILHGTLDSGKQTV